MTTTSNQNSIIAHARQHKNHTESMHASETTHADETMHADDNPLIADLTREQREAVTTRASPLCIIAGAGSGKTRVLTRRIAWQVSQGIVNPQQVLAVTFTRRAARELRFRLKQLDMRNQVKAGTFHSIALSQLRNYEAEQGRRPCKILTERSAVVTELLNGRTPKHKFSRGKSWNSREYQNRAGKTASRSRIGDSSVTALVHEISWARARLVKPDDYPAKAAAAGRRPLLGSTERFAELYGSYEAIKRQQRMLDLDDVLENCRRLMNKQSAYAAAQRWLHQHLLVDEFQDINPLQFSLLKSWLGNDSTVVIVGDPDQAIYGWNGADPELIRNASEHFLGCAVVRLRTNFRSTPEILAAAGRLLGKPAQPTHRLSGNRPTVTAVSDTEEPTVLARAVRNRQPLGAPWRMQAVLARTNAQLRPLQRALTRQGIPTNLRRGNDLIRQPEVVSLIGDWRFQSHQNNASLATCIADTRMSLTNALNRSQSYANSQGSEFTWQSAAAHSKVDTMASVTMKIDEFLNFAEDHLMLNPDATVDSFTTDMGLFRGVSFSPQDGVDLLTFHAAKGLEWPIVHLVGLEDGYVPLARARDKRARSEELRLLYVAVTRALRELHVMWCDQRTVNGRMRRRKPSPWLSAIRTPETDSAEDCDPVEAVIRARLALRKAAEPLSEPDPNPHSQQALPL